MLVLYCVCLKRINAVSQSDSQSVVPQYVLTSMYACISPALCFILVHNCGLTVRNKRICYVMLLQYSATLTAGGVIINANRQKSKNYRYLL